MFLPHMKKMFSLIFLLAYGSLTFITLEAQTTEFSSHMELSINRYIMDHRFGLHALTINVEMDGTPIACEDKITNEIKDFLANYPNPEDYWEIVNKKLIILLSKIYPNQNKIQTILSIEPDSTKPFSRKSICKLNNGEIEQQIFSFSILNYPFRNNLIRLGVDIEYDPNASSNDYINFFTVRDVIEVFTKENGLLNLPESVFPEKIARHLLTYFTNAKSFSVTLEIPPHACNPTRCCWKAIVFQKDIEIIPTASSAL